MLKKLPYSVDLEPLRNLLSTVVWDSHGRCSLNSPTGNRLYDPYTVNQEWKGTAFETLLNEIPYDIGEARLMKLEPGTCYRSHADADDRYHLNLISNEHCYLIDLDDQKMYPLVSDSNLYYMDGSKLHTATNFGSTSRVQLVIRVPLKKYDDPDFVSVEIKVKNPPVNLRYLVDQYVSPLINRYSKLGLIGYFNPLSDLIYSLTLDISVLDKILKQLTQLNVEYDIRSDNI